MSAIIRFPLERVQSAPSNAEPGQKSADILIFEGVQYVKHHEANAPTEGETRKASEPFIP